MSTLLEDTLNAGWDPGRLPEQGRPGGFTPPDDGSISFPDDGFGGALDAVESGAWLDHRAAEAIAAFRKYGVTSLWEVGAGNGFMTLPCQRAGLDVVAIEPLSRAAVRLSQHGIPVFEATLEDLKLPADIAPAIGAFDVLEHLPDPHQLIAEIFRTLQPGGLAVVTVPGGQWLWGDLDDAVGHFRRYSRASLRQAFCECGFQEVETRWLFMSLVLPAALTRALPYRLGRRRPSGDALATRDRQLTSGGVLERGLRSVLRAETAASRHVSLPVGLTLLGVFRRPAVHSR